VEVFRAGGSLYLMGNGGSASDCQHMAGELVGRFLMERAPLPCLALTTDTSILTAVGNDYSFGDVFLKQVQAFVRKGDAVVGISTSGNAGNINAAMDEARERGALTIGLTGRDGGALAGKCDLALIVQAQDTPRIQEAHATVIHILCDLIERTMFA
jgi:D-sedoheptulose 7-phosphate isomerase